MYKFSRSTERGCCRYSEDMELEDAIHTSLLTLKEGFEGQIAADNIGNHLIEHRVVASLYPLCRLVIISSLLSSFIVSRDG